MFAAIRKRIHPLQTIVLLWIFLLLGLIFWVRSCDLNDNRVAKVVPLARPTAMAAPAPSAIDDNGEEEPDDPPAEPETSGLSDAPDRQDLDAAMQKILPQISACAAYGGDGQEPLVAKIRINRAGVAESVTILPPHESSERAACVADTLKRAAYPHFRGIVRPTIEWTYPFYL